MRNPEVMRVYLGSFWDQPLQNEDTRKLLEAEMNVRSSSRVVEG